MSVARHPRLSVAANVLVAALLACAFATAAVAHPSHAAQPPVAATRAGHHTTPTPPSRRPPADEALEYVSLGTAVEHAASEQRAHARTSAPAGSPEPLTLSPPTATADRTSWAVVGLVVIAVIALTAVGAIGVRRVRNRRRSVHLAL